MQAGHFDSWSLIENTLPGLQAGVDAEKLSHEEYIQVKGETVSSTFTTPGEYSYYCGPHQGGGMVGKITVQ